MYKSLPCESPESPSDMSVVAVMAALSTVMAVVASFFFFFFPCHCLVLMMRMRIHQLDYFVRKTSTVDLKKSVMGDEISFFMGLLSSSPTNVFMPSNRREIHFSAIVREINQRKEQRNKVFSPQLECKSWNLDLVEFEGKFRKWLELFHFWDQNNNSFNS